jgi:predicted O-methyltransferase YrrM
MAELAGLASGATPAATFPNSHLQRQTTPGTWAPPQQQCALDELRKAVQAEDWAGNYAESITKIHMQAEWSAGPERCAMLQAIAATSRASRVLEVGSFCGAAALALAEALPEGAEVLSLELDEYAVDLGKRFQARSPAGHKIKHMVGPADASLKELAETAGDGKPFDLVVLDADKERMELYFDLLWSTPGLLSEFAVVCVDLTPFKGQPPLRYQKYGFPYLEEGSGQKAIDALRARLAASPEVAAYEFGQMMVVQRRRG